MFSPGPNLHQSPTATAVQIYHRSDTSRKFHCNNSQFYFRFGQERTSVQVFFPVSLFDIHSKWGCATNNIVTFAEIAADRILIIIIIIITTITLDDEFPLLWCFLKHRCLQCCYSSSRLSPPECIHLRSRQTRCSQLKAFNHKRTFPERPSHYEREDGTTENDRRNSIDYYATRCGFMASQQGGLWRSTAIPHVETFRKQHEQFKWIQAGDASYSLVVLWQRGGFSRWALSLTLWLEHFC